MSGEKSVDIEKPKEAPITKQTFVQVAGGVLALSLAFGVRYAYVNDKKESDIANIFPSKDQHTDVAAVRTKSVGKLPTSTIKLPNQNTSSILSRLSRNQSGVSLAFRAFMIGSALCFSTFFVAGSAFMYLNDLHSFEDADRMFKARMKRSVLAKYIKEEDPKDTEEAEKWFQDLFGTPSDDRTVDSPRVRVEPLWDQFKNKLFNAFGMGKKPPATIDNGGVEEVTGDRNEK